MTDRIRKMLVRYQKTPPKSELDRLFEAVFAHEDEKVIADISDELDRYNALTPNEFLQVAEEIRAEMNLSASRLILPRVPIGTRVVRLARPIGVDLILGVSYAPCAIVTERAADALHRSGLTGFRLIPIGVVGPAACSLYTLIVDGDGGVPKPATGNGEWRQCDECHRWRLWGILGPVRQTVDQTGWDGTDFFHLAGRGSVYITDRARQFFKESKLNLILDMEPIGTIELVPSFPLRPDPPPITPPPWPPPYG